MFDIGILVGAGTLVVGAGTLVFDIGTLVAGTGVSTFGLATTGLRTATTFGGMVLALFIIIKITKDLSLLSFVATSFFIRS